MDPIFLVVTILVAFPYQTVAQDANSKFADRCKAKNVGQSCIPSCNYDKSLDDLVNAVTNGKCKFEDFLPFLKAAAGDKDHTSCCEKAGVSKRCTIFCNPEAKVPTDTVELIGYLDCRSSYEQNRKCFKEGA